MQRTERRISAPAEQFFEKMACIVREPIDARIAALWPTREQIDGERKPIHFGEQRDDERAKRTERTPIPPGLRLEEAEREQDEDGRVQHHQPPKPIGWNIILHESAP